MSYLALKSEKRKRELSPASDTPEEDDLPPPKKVEKKTTKGKKEFTKTESSAVDLSSMINIGGFFFRRDASFLA